MELGTQRRAITVTSHGDVGTLRFDIGGQSEMVTARTCYTI